jgi:hypothetical protein
MGAIRGVRFRGNRAMAQPVKSAAGEVLTNVPR